MNPTTAEDRDFGVSVGHRKATLTANRKCLQAGRAETPRPRRGTITEQLHRRVSSRVREKNEDRVGRTETRRVVQRAPPAVSARALVIMIAHTANVTGTLAFSIFIRLDERNRENEGETRLLAMTHPNWRCALRETSFLTNPLATSEASPQEGISSLRLHYQFEFFPRGSKCSSTSNTKVIC